MWCALIDWYCWTCFLRENNTERESHFEWKFSKISLVEAWRRRALDKALEIFQNSRFFCKYHSYQFNLISRFWFVKYGRTAESMSKKWVGEESRKMRWKFFIIWKSTLGWVAISTTTRHDTMRMMTMMERDWKAQWTLDVEKMWKWK
jgi:hypothetical protein